MTGTPSRPSGAGGDGNSCKFPVTGVKILYLLWRENFMLELAKNSDFCATPETLTCWPLRGIQ